MYNKYKNIKTEINGKTFDSKREAKRYSELLLLERAKEIHNLKTQVAFILIPSYLINGKKVREIKYIADFTYEDKENNFIVEDVKPSKEFQTEVYKIKKKLFMYKYKIEIKEIY